MRIALIHSHLEERGGSQRYVLEIAKALRCLGHDACVFTYYYSPTRCFPEIACDIRIEAVRTLKSGERRQAGRRFEQMVAWMPALGLDALAVQATYGVQRHALADMILKAHASIGGFDALFVHEGLLGPWAAALVKRATGLPLVWFCYDTPDMRYMDWLPTRRWVARIRGAVLDQFWRYDRWLMRRIVDRAFVLDREAARRFSAFYGYEPRVQGGGVAARNLSRDRTNAIRERYGVGSDRLIVSCVTRFERYRRIHDLFELASRPGMAAAFFFYINAPVGDRVYYVETLNRYGSLLHPKGNVVLDTAYPVNDDELFTGVYRASDLFIFPNEHQTWGNAPLEAMANGCVALVSDGCGISDVIRPVSETVFPVADISALDTMLRGLSSDRERLHSIADAQHALVRDSYTWERIVPRYVDVMLEIKAR